MYTAGERQTEGRSLRLDQKVAVVVGASDPLGDEVARALAAAGAAVLLTGVEIEPLAQLAGNIRREGGQVRIRRLDPLAERDWEATIAHALEQFGGVDILVNKGSLGAIRNFTDCSLEDFQEMQVRNIAGVFLGIKHGIQAMRPDGSVGRGGSIINLTPRLELDARAGLASQFASLGAVRMLSKAAALECTAFGYDISVNSIHPVSVGDPDDLCLLKALGDDGGGLDIFPASPQANPGRPLLELILDLATDTGRAPSGYGYIVNERA